MINRLQRKIAVVMAIFTIVFNTPIQSNADTTTPSLAEYETSGFVVTVPKEIRTIGKDDATYSVEVTADFTKVDEVTVVPDSSVLMMQGFKSDKELEITQDLSTWDRNNAGVVGNGKIEMESLTAGTWNGVFSFTINHKVHEHVKIKGGSLKKEATNTSNAVYHYKCEECLIDLPETYEEEKEKGVLELNATTQSTCANTIQEYEVINSSGDIQVSIADPLLADVIIEDLIIRVIPKKTGETELTITSKETVTTKPESIIINAAFYPCTQKEEGGSNKFPANCQSPAVHYYRCIECKKDMSETYETGELGPHTVIWGEKENSCEECSICKAVLKETHEYEQAEYNWEENNSEVVCTATISCVSCNYIETEVATLETEIKKTPTCTTDGEMEVIATFLNPKFETQIKTITTPKTGHIPVNKSEENACKVCNVCNEIITASHAYTEPIYTWEGIYCTAKRLCTECGYNHEETIKVESTIITQPSCVSEGEYEHTATFKNQCFETQKIKESIPALGHTPVSSGEDNVCKKCKVCNEVISSNHTYDKPTYTWGDLTCVARRTCMDCGYIQTESPNYEYAVTKESTCTETGTGIYTVSYTNPAFKTQIKTISLEKIEHTFVNGNMEEVCKKCLVCNGYIDTEHDYNTPIYTWEDDKCHALKTCMDCEYTKSETSTGNSSIELSPTCNKEGIKKWTCSFITPGFETQTKTVAINPVGHTKIAGGTKDICKKCSDCGETISSNHDYQTATYTWSNNTCTATRECAYCEYIDTESATGVYYVITPAGCETTGTGAYHVEFSNPDFEKQTKEFELNATGHDAISVGTIDVCKKCNTCNAVITSMHNYNPCSYAWNNNTCTATRECSVCGYTQTESTSGVYSVVSNATCTANGSAKYTATFANPAFETQIKRVSLTKLGHVQGSTTTSGSSTGITGYKSQNTCTRCGEVLALTATYDYTGTVVTFTAPRTATYSIELFGAAGGDATSGGGGIGGKGGKTTGNIALLKGQSLYIAVGGKPINNSGGYNGGAWGNHQNNNYSVNNWCGGGGGATSITTTNRGVLKNFASYKGEVLLVAGGGGGAGEQRPGYEINNGGTGGGLTGGAGAGKNAGGGGSQTAGGACTNTPGSFGQGSSPINLVVTQGYSNYYAGGGGGGYYGGGGGEWWCVQMYSGSSGGGGSAYINSSYISNGTTTNGVKSGNGQVTIKLV